MNKEESQEKKEKNYIHREIRHCSMSRNIFLADADSEKIKAKLDDGVLRIIVEKKNTPDNSRFIESE